MIDFGYSQRPGGQMENGVPIKCAGSSAPVCSHSLVREFAWSFSMLAALGLGEILPAAKATACLRISSFVLSTIMYSYNDWSTA